LALSSARPRHAGGSIAAIDLDQRAAGAGEINGVASRLDVKRRDRLERYQS
jgi:hypothetical protein